MKTNLINFYFGVKSWTLNRRSADTTTEKTSWVAYGLIAGIIVVVAILVALGIFTDWFSVFIEGITTGSNTKAPGEWGK